MTQLDDHMLAQPKLANGKRPRVRFAPSPTGLMHIGGYRTALFDWLYARRTGGEFILRIEDTDTLRTAEGAVEFLIEGMLHWSESESIVILREVPLSWTGDNHTVCPSCSEDFLSFL